MRLEAERLKKQLPSNWWEDAPPSSSPDLFTEVIPWQSLSVSSYLFSKAYTMFVCPQKIDNTQKTVSNVCVNRNTIACVVTMLEARVKLSLTRRIFIRGPSF